MDKIPEIMKIGYQSLRKISNTLKYSLELKYLTKQSRIGQQNPEETINNGKFEYSGYYLYNGQF